MTQEELAQNHQEFLGKGTEELVALLMRMGAEPVDMDYPFTAPSYVVSQATRIKQGGKVQVTEYHLNILPMMQRLAEMIGDKS